MGVNPAISVKSMAEPGVLDGKWKGRARGEDAEVGESVLDS